MWRFDDEDDTAYPNVPSSAFATAVSPKASRCRKPAVCFTGRTSVVAVVLQAVDQGLASWTWTITQQERRKPNRYNHTKASMAGHPLLLLCRELVSRLLHPQLHILDFLPGALQVV